LQRDVGIARPAEVEAMQVDGVRQRQRVGGFSQGRDHSARSERPAGDGLVKVGDVAVAALPQLGAAGIGQLDGIGLGGVEPPGHGLAQFLGAAGRDELEEQVVVPQQDVEAFVHDRRVIQLRQGLASAQRGHGRVHYGGIAQRGVTLAGGKGAGHAAARARAPQGGAGLRITPVIFGQQPPGQADRVPGDVAVQVYAAGHQHQAARIEGGGLGRQAGDNLPGVKAHVAHLAGHAMQWIEHS